MTTSHPRHRLAGRPSPQRRVLRDARVLTALMLVAVGIATLGKPLMNIPGIVNGAAHAHRSLNLQLFHGFVNPTVWYGPWVDTCGNIVLFMPLAALLIVVGRNSSTFRFGLGGTLLLGMVLSLGIEVAQYIFALGYSDIDDVLCNTLGTMLGALLMQRTEREKEHHVLRQLGFFVVLAVLVLVGCLLTGLV